MANNAVVLSPLLSLQRTRIACNWCSKSSLLKPILIATVCDGLYNILVDTPLPMKTSTATCEEIWVVRYGHCPGVEPGHTLQFALCCNLVHDILTLVGQVQMQLAVA